MKRFIFSLMLVLILGMSVLAPSFAFAQGGDASSEGGVVPCGTTNNPEDCGFCHVFELTENVFTFVIFRIVPALAIIMIIWGGIVFLTSTGNPDRISQGKKILFSTFIGFIIAYGAYLIVGSILGVIVEESAMSGFFKFKNGSIVIECGEEDFVSPFRPDPNTVPGTAADKQFAGAGINIKSGVSLDGVRQTTIDEIVWLKNRCNCSITITEGTGGSHASGLFSHSNGYKLDLRSTGLEAIDLNNYIFNNFNERSRRSDGARQWLNISSGAVYALESDHWDVLVN